MNGSTPPPEMRLARWSSSQAARRRLTRMERLPAFWRIRLLAICLMLAKLAGALWRRMRHASSRRTMSITLAFGVGGHRKDVEPYLLFSLPADDFTHALDHDDALQAGPVMTLFEPINSVDRGVRSCLDTAVNFRECLMPADDSVLELAGFLLSEEDFDVLAQRPLIVLAPLS